MAKLRCPKKSTGILVFCGLILHLLLSGSSYAISSAGDDGLGVVSDLSLQQLFVLNVTSTGFFELSAAKAPGSVFIITPELLKNASSEKLGDLIEQYVPGVVVGTNVRFPGCFGTRGIVIDNSAKTLFMNDGQNINMRMHFGYNVPLLSTLTGDIRSIEVINGPGAIVHGTGAINGFVNMLPKTGETHQGIEASYTYGSGSGSFIDQYQKVEVGGGFSYGEKHNLHLYGGFVRSLGDDYDNMYGYDHRAGIIKRDTAAIVRARDSLIRVNPSNQQGIDSLTNLYTSKIRKADSVGNYNKQTWPEWRANAYPEPNYKLSAVWNHGIFDFQTMLHNTTVGANADDIDKWQDPEGSTYTTMLTGRPRVTIPLGNDDWSLEVGMPFEATDYAVTRKDSIIASRANYLGHDAAGGSEIHFEGKPIVRTSIVPNANIAAGLLGGQRYFRGRTSIFTFLGHEDSTGFLETIEGSWTEAALFGEGTYQLDALTAIVGLRYDMVTYQGLKPANPLWSLPEVKPEPQGHFSPRLALSYGLTDEHVVKASYQEGFRYPDAAYYIHYLRYNVALERSNMPTMADLKPEVMRNIEVNYSGSIPGLHLSVSTNAYFNMYENTLYWRPDGNGLSAQQIDSIKAVFGRSKGSLGGWAGGCFGNASSSFSGTGLELVLAYTPTDLTRIQVAQSFSMPINSSDANMGLVVPDSVNSSWPRFPAYMLKISATQKLFERVAVTLDPTLRSPIEYAADPEGFSNKTKFTMNAGIEGQITKPLSVELRATNIFENDVPTWHEGGAAEPLGMRGAGGTDIRHIYFGINYKI